MAAAGERAAGSLPVVDVIGQYVFVSTVTLRSTPFGTESYETC